MGQLSRFLSARKLAIFIRFSAQSWPVADFYPHYGLGLKKSKIFSPPLKYVVGRWKLASLSYPLFGVERMRSRVFNIGVSHYEYRDKICSRKKDQNIHKIKHTFKTIYYTLAQYFRKVGVAQVVKRHGVDIW